MTITIADLERLASEEPLRFLATLDHARRTALERNPVEAKKFMWGETGADPFDANAIINSLRDMSDGSVLQGLIASAVGGIDLEGSMGASVQVAATMRSAIARIVVSELSSNPDGELATAFKEAMAPSVAAALKAVFESGAVPAPATEADGAFDFTVDEGSNPWTAEMPGPVGAR